MATSMSDFDKASDLFCFNKFEIEEYFIVTGDFIGLEEDWTPLNHAYS